ncbi:hypothetical protein MNBD_ALPHA04-1869 [hydrothermal vent metagenome]|uniref:Uncharacterized protein n=1 Tax=hydrothermal vent metagenome TaxID=652676 RepID=A0A3B0SSK3_9ZZZZ
MDWLNRYSAFAGSLKDIKMTVLSQPQRLYSGQRELVFIHRISHAAAFTRFQLVLEIDGPVSY